METLTSANTTYYTLAKLDGTFAGRESQNCMCRSTIRQTLADKYQPVDQYLVQLNHPDEDEVDHFSKWMNLQAYLAGERVAWEEDEVTEELQGHLDRALQLLRDAREYILDTMDRDDPTPVMCNRIDSFLKGEPDGQT